VSKRRGSQTIQFHYFSSTTLISSAVSPLWQLTQSDQRVNLAFQPFDLAQGRLGRVRRWVLALVKKLWNTKPAKYPKAAKVDRALLSRLSCPFASFAIQTPYFPSTTFISSSVSPLRQLIHERVNLPLQCRRVRVWVFALGGGKMLEHETREISESRESRPRASFAVIVPFREFRDPRSLFLLLSAPYGN